MSASRVVRILGMIASLSVVGCDVTPDPSRSPASIVPSMPVASPTKAAASDPGAAGSGRAVDANWQPAGELRLGRSRTHVARLADGTVLVVGADNICSPGYAWDDSGATEVGDPLTGSWSKAQSLPAPRDRFALAALPDGRVLVAGGTTRQGADLGPRSYSSTYLFDPTSGSWSRSDLLEAARSDPAVAVLANGRVLVAGGFFVDIPADPQHRMLDTSEVFDPSTGSWSRTGPLAVARYGASAVTLADGRVLILGGWPDVENGPAPRYEPHAPPLASAEIYDPATGRWSQAGELDLARTDFVLVALADGGALLAGGDLWMGSEPSLQARTPTSKAERFDPGSGAWSETGDMASAAAGRTGIWLPGGQVLVAGGDATVHEPDVDFPESRLIADAELYDPETGTWATTTPMPYPRSLASAVLLEDGSALIVGGIRAHASPGDTPACPIPEPQALRYAPGP